MSQHALARMRRSRPREASLRVITFPLRHYWFCLPLSQARRALAQPISRTGTDVGLIELHNEAIPVMNAANLVYGQTPPQPPASVQPSAPSAPVKNPVQSIIVVNNSKGDLIGLRIDGTPTIKRVRQSAIKPVPPVYLTIHHLRGISYIVDLPKSTSDEISHPIFWLEVDSLLEPFT